MNTIGDNIRRIRRDAGKTLEDLAVVAGTSAQNFGQYERGERTCGIMQLCYIARILGCTIDDLLEGTECGDVIRPRPGNSAEGAATLGERIRSLRKAAGLTQEELGQRLRVEKSSVSEWEGGKRAPVYSRLQAIAAALNVTVAQLLGEVVTPADLLDDSPTTNPIKGGITMNPITLNELLMVTSVRRLDVTVTLTRTLTATIQVDSNDLGQWDEISHLYGEFAVREISLTGDALAVSITPPTRVKLTKGGD